MGGNRDVIFGAFKARGEAHVAARLSRDCVAELRGREQGRDHLRHEEASRRDDLVLDEMKADHGRFFRGVKVAGNGVPNHGS